MELVIFIGIPGSGKSSFYKRFFFDSHMRVNLDMLKHRKREEALFDLCLRLKMPMVIDNTNVKTTERSVYIIPAIAEHYRIKGYYFNVPVNDALLRNSERTGKAKVSDKAVHIKHRQLEIPKHVEGFHELYEVSVIPPSAFKVQEMYSGPLLA